jgi:hypothetical protein
VQVLVNIPARGKSEDFSHLSPPVFSIEVNLEGDLRAQARASPLARP